MSLGLVGSFGQQALRDSIRQRIAEEQAQRQREFQNSIELRRVAVDEQDSTNRRDEHSAMMREREAQHIETEAAKASGTYSIDQSIPEPMAKMLQGTMQAPNVQTNPPLAQPPNMPGMMQPDIVPGMQPGAVWKGTDAQRATRSKQQYLGRLIDSLPPGDRERKALEFNQGTGGDNPPAGMWEPKAVATPQENHAANRKFDIANPLPQAPTNDTSRRDHSYDTQSKRLDALEKPLADRAERVGRLVETLNQNSPLADSLIAPELLTAMAGGQGSGLRINEAEIQRVMGGRTQWESLKARLAAWQADPTKPFSITPEQRKQARALITAIAARDQKRLALIDDARSQMIDAPDVATHRRVVDAAKKALNADTLDDAGGAPAPAAGGIKVLSITPVKR